MGCDIHIHTEKRVPKNDGTFIWVNTDNFTHSETKQESEFLFNPIYRGRDYKLFSILAGVRGISANQIDVRRGLPPDVSDFTKKQMTEYDHSPSYFTMKELLNYKKRMNKRKTYIWIKQSEWEFYHDVIDEIDLDDVYFEDPHIVGYVKKKWSPLYKGFNDFLKLVKRKMIADLNPDNLISKKVLFKDYSDNYRIVFWFDS